MNEDIVIVAAKRTPIGNLLGQLSSLTAPELAAFSHKAALDEATLLPKDITEVISGCVLSAGIGQAPARQGAIYAGIPYSSGATTINKMCGSGMQALIFATHIIQHDPAAIILAGGMESMSQAPYIIPGARKGLRLGHTPLIDSLYLDGLEDAYDKGHLMGFFAEKTAKQFGFTREAQDDYAKRSLMRALEAQKNHAFSEEIAPVTVSSAKAEHIISQDENPDPAKLEKIARLKPVFDPEGTITAANSSSISDGAASLILMRSKEAAERHIKPLAIIKAIAHHAKAPAEFTTAPIEAIEKILKKTGWSKDSVDLFEINEAFAVVTMAAIKTLELAPDRVNIHGGACALGHPIGASGARIVVTLIHALKQQKKKRGIAALCIGGGEATAIAIELIEPINT